MVHVKSFPQRISTLVAFSTLLTLSTFYSSVSANLMLNPGFEIPVNNNGEGFGNWVTFSLNDDPNVGTVVARNSTIEVRTGLGSVELGIDGVENSYAGLYQTLTDSLVGQLFTFTGWHIATLDEAEVELRLEWFDISGLEIARTGNLIPTVTDEFSKFTLSGLAPHGAESVRTVYTTVSFGNMLTQQIFVDDFSLDVVDVAAPNMNALFGITVIGFGSSKRYNARKH